MHPAPRYFQWVRNVAYVFLSIEFKLGDETEETVACPAFLVRHTAEDLVTQFLNVALPQIHESFLIHSSNRVYSDSYITPIIYGIFLPYKVRYPQSRPKPYLGSLAVCCFQCFAYPQGERRFIQFHVVVGNVRIFVNGLDELCVATQA